MKRFFVTVTIILVGFLVFSSVPVEAARVRGHIRGNGTYVEPHYRSSPNSFKGDNYSSWGNTNPYTGKRGYKKW